MDIGHGELNLLDYWVVLKRRRWVVYLALVSVVLIALIGSFLITPLYRAEVTLQIERLSPDILTFRELSRSDYSWAAYSDFYQTQYKIIASTGVARKTAEQLGLDSHPMFERGESGPGLLARLKSLLPGKVSLAPPDPLDTAAAQVLSGLAVTPVRDSQLVIISWVASEPNLAAEVANTVADAYIQYTIESQYSTTAQAEDFLVNQIGKLKREIAASEELLQRYGESKRIISIDDTANITMKGLRDLSEKRTAAQSELAQAKARAVAVQQAESQALEEVMNSALISRLREEHAEIEARYSEMARTFKPDWPPLQELGSKLEQSRLRLDLESQIIADQVRAAAESDRIRALAEVQNLGDLLRNQEDAAQQLRRDAVEYATLSSEVEKKRDILNRLMRRQNEMSLSADLRELDSTSTNVRIVEQAQAPRAHFRPNTKLNLVLATIFGLGLGVGMALLLDYMDNTVKSANDLERLVTKPILSVIPHHGRGGTTLVRRRTSTGPGTALDLISHLDARTSVSEAYRELRTAILLSHAGQPPVHIMITSALPEEGKSATSMNLAIVLAQMGKRVLLVDTDLRRPRLDKAMKVANQRGVSTFLSGLEDASAPLTVTTEVPNLHIMPSGPIPPNPSELLNSPRFLQMGQELAESGYDHIVYDSAPVLSVADAVIIANTVDSSILVVRAGRTARQSVRAAVDKLSQAQGAPSGIVLNGLERETHGYRYYYRTEYHSDHSAQPEGGKSASKRVGSAES